MAQQRGGLGKGLNELLASTLGPQDGDVATLEKDNKVAPLVGLTEIAINKIQPGAYQPRTVMVDETIEQLSESIKQQGILQPIVLRQSKQGYEIIAGERRWRAAQRAGLTQVPAVVKDLTDAEAMAVGLIENIQRENLSPIDEAQGLSRLANEWGLTHLEVAEAVGMSRAKVTNLLRLLNLNDEVKDLIQSGELDLGHAKVLLALKGSLQTQVAGMIVSRGLSVRETERIIQRFQSTEEGTKVLPEVDPNIKKLETDLTDKLGAPVAIRHGSKGKGSLVIQYNDLSELDGILDHIQ